LYNNGGILTIDQCDFIGNHFTISDSVHYYGGGIYSEGGTLNVFDSRFEDNGSGDKYSHGGGIANINTTGQILRTTFQNNSSVGCWQGIPCTHPGGGGYYQSGASVTIQDSIFISNTATYGGGGVAIRGYLSITNSSFSGNSATAAGDNGGGVANLGELIITNSTFSGNSVPDSGGGIGNIAGEVILRNTIVASSISGGNCGGEITNGGNNLDDGTTCGWGSDIGSMSSTNPMLGLLTGFPQKAH
jgi:hypothetical protein